MLIARAAHRRWFAIGAVLGTIICCAASMRAPFRLLTGPNIAIGIEATQFRGLLPDDVAAAVYDSDKPIILVGDAKAFWYAIPSSRLRYRSVFDVPATGNFRDAWLGNDTPDDTMVIVDPGELSRFAKTYRNLPVMPKEWIGRSEPFVIRAADIPR